MKEYIDKGELLELLEKTFEIGGVTFKTTDFVQVQYWCVIDSGEPITYWRNGLFVGVQNNCAVVLYTDGSKEVLSNDTKIIKPQYR